MSAVFVWTVGDVLAAVVIGALVITLVAAFVIDAWDRRKR